MNTQIEPIDSMPQSIAIESMRQRMRKASKRMEASLLLLLLVSCAQRCAIAQQETHAVTTAAVTLQAHTATAAEQSEDSAAKDAAQNPVAAAISVPFQNNVYYGVGPYRRAENALLIEPVIPFRLSQKWMVISRTITPAEVVPRISSNDPVDYGLGNIQPQFYFSPAHPGKFIWGAGPQLWLPTATDSELGTNKWGGGPARAFPLIV